MTATLVDDLDVRPVPTTWCARCGWDHAAIHRTPADCANGYNPRSIPLRAVVVKAACDVLDRLATPIGSADETEQHARRMSSAYRCSQSATCSIACNLARAGGAS